MASMIDGTSKLWVVETQGRGLSVSGFTDEFEAADHLLYRLWTQMDREELKTRIRKMAEDLCIELGSD